MDAGEFRRELGTLINSHSMENGSNTPDFMLADYLMACLRAFDVAVVAREKWYGRGAIPCDPPGLEVSPGHQKTKER